MSSGDWRLFRIRPGNFPTRRLAAMSYLLLRYREKGLLTSLIDLVRNAPEEKAADFIQKGLIVTGDVYWSEHFDFGKKCCGMGDALIGKSRAAVIVVNILLPFATAWAHSTSQSRLAEKAFRLYCDYPALQENTLDRHMSTQMGLNRTIVNSACRQQGLLHIYRNFCIKGSCPSCPVRQD
jgi:hypothetical protein